MPDYTNNAIFAGIMIICIRNFSFMACQFYLCPNRRGYLCPQNWRQIHYNALEVSFYTNFLLINFSVMWNFDQYAYASLSNKTELHFQFTYEGPVPDLVTVEDNLRYDEI